MKKGLITGFIIEVLIVLVSYYFLLPPINITSFGFWGYIALVLGSFIVVMNISNSILNGQIIYRINRTTSVPKLVKVPIMILFAIFVVILLIDIACSPFFNAKSYSRRIEVTELDSFTEHIKPVDFNSLPLLDRDSSMKLGDRVMGQMSELVSQYYVSDEYTQINYNNEIIRVSPLEYADFIKWISNRKKGVTGYITVNSVNGKTNLTKLKTGMKYLPSAFFGENLYRKLRFSYPTTNFGEIRFEIDNEGNPYFIVSTLTYTGINLKTKVSGVIIFDPITGDSKKYSINEVPTWVDNAYSASLLIEQLDNWGTYRSGFLNSIFGQKNVVKTTEGYNYLAIEDDIYLYTGITSVLSDESNIGFVLSNMRTGKTSFYPCSGAQEYSAMASAEGQVQQMKYKSTFPLLINLNNRPTYLVSLKDAAELVKMYAFIDVVDYQKVVVSDASKGIEEASINYLKSMDGINSSSIIKREITVKKIKNVTIDGMTYFYIADEDNKKYKVSIKLSDKLPFIESNNKLTIGYYKENTITEIVKIYYKIY